MDRSAPPPRIQGLVSFSVYSLSLLLCFVTACTDVLPEDLTSDNTVSTSRALTTEELGYTVLTAEERALAERQPWEVPGSEHLRPDQEVLDAMVGAQPIQPDPALVARHKLLRSLWEAEASKLESAGLNEEELHEAEIAFTDRFFEEHVRQPMDSSDSVDSTDEASHE